jgi:hypothetical protein
VGKASFFSPVQQAVFFCLKKLLFYKRKAVLLLLLGMGLWREEKHDFLIFFFKLQVGKTTGVSNIVLQTLVMFKRTFPLYARSQFKEI